MRRPPAALIKWIAVGLSFGFVLGAFIMFAIFTESRCSSSNRILDETICPLYTGTCYPIMKATREYFDLDATLSFTCPWSPGTLGLAYISVIFSLAFLVLLLLGLKIKTITVVNMRVLIGFVGAILMLGTFIITVIEINSGPSLPDDVRTGNTEDTYTVVPYNGNIALVFLSFFFLLCLSVFELFTYHKNMSEVLPGGKTQFPANAKSPEKPKSSEKAQSPAKSPEKGIPTPQHNQNGYEQE